MFTCKRCEYNTQYKKDIINHFQRKKPCTVSNEDISTEHLLQEIHDLQSIKKYKCYWCPRSYSKSFNLNRHKKNCPNNPNLSGNMEQSTDDHNDFQIMLEERQKTNNNITNNTNLIIQDLHRRIKDLEETNRRILEKNRNEAYYQHIIEIFLGNTHEDLIVKGSLMGTTDISTPSLHGEIKTWKKWKYAMGQLIAYNTCNLRPEMNAYMFGRYEEAHKREASNIMKSNGVTVYDLHDTENGVDIIEYETHNMVYRYDASVKNENHKINGL
jgi:hypothetical protein